MIKGFTNNITELIAASTLLITFSIIGGSIIACMFLKDIRDILKGQR